MGGTIANFPPMAAVGVYVEIAVPTMLLGLINGGAELKTRYAE